VSNEEDDGGQLDAAVSRVAAAAAARAAVDVTIAWRRTFVATDVVVDVVSGQRV